MAISWKKQVRLLTNYYMMKDFIIFYLVVVIIFFIFLLAMAGFDAGRIVVLWAACSGALLILLLFASLVVFRNRISIEYDLNPEGIRITLGSRERKISSIAIVVGALAGSPETVGAGLMAKSREVYFAPWKDVSEVTIAPGRKVISLKNGRVSRIRLFCTEESFSEAEKIVREYAKP